MYLCHKYSGAKLKEIGERFGIGQSAVSPASRRFMVEMVRDQELRSLVDNIEVKLGLSDFWEGKTVAWIHPLYPFHP
ncbi:MAG: hypothetical protein IBX46_10265 [Desulfuromonadales bacterium]|nr:hypothetical protein [Desulfuromonadales bacterium]